MNNKLAFFILLSIFLSTGPVVAQEEQVPEDSIILEMESADEQTAVSEGTGTGHKNRLDRKNKFDDNKKSYAYEELVAEIGSIFFGFEFNITKTIRDNHAKYLNSWISNLNNDYTFLTGATDMLSQLWMQNQNKKWCRN